MNVMTPDIEAHNQQAARTWDAGGSDYERISQQIADAISHAVEALQLLPGQRALDIATGTGLAARRCAERGASVAGIDFAESVIRCARQLAGGHRIDFRVGHAERLPFGDAAFDAVISTFGVMFARDPAAAAAEIGRVCRPGGRIALAVWPATSSVYRMFRLIQRHQPRPRASTPAPSPFDWARTDRAIALLGDDFELDFDRGVSIYREPSAQDAWEAFRRGFGPVRSLVASLSPERVRALEGDFVAFHQRFTTSSGMLLPREYYLILGRRR